MAVERTVSRARPMVSLPSGDSSTMRIGKVPEVRATTGKRSVVFSRVRSRTRVVAAGELELVALQRHDDLSGCPVWFWNVTGISPSRAVRVIERPSGMSTASSWSSMAWPTPWR